MSGIEMIKEALTIKNEENATYNKTYNKKWKKFQIYGRSQYKSFLQEQMKMEMTPFERKW